MTNTALSFSQLRADGTTDNWVPHRTGNYTSDCARGREYFHEAQNYAHENPLIFMRVIQAMIAKNECSGVEIGFLTHLSLLASERHMTADLLDAPKVA